MIIAVSSHILLVDDEELLIRLTKRKMEQMGYTVSAYASSMEALEHFSHAPQLYDLVLTDLSMPELDGLGLAREICLTRPDIPIILATGDRNGYSEQDFFASGIREILDKPVSMSVLADSLRKNLA